MYAPQFFYASNSVLECKLGIQQPTDTLTNKPTCSPHYKLPFLTLSPAMEMHYLWWCKCLKLPSTGQPTARQVTISYPTVVMPTTSRLANKQTHMPYKQAYKGLCYLGSESQDTVLLVLLGLHFSLKNRSTYETPVILVFHVQMHHQCITRVKLLSNVAPTSSHKESLKAIYLLDNVFIHYPRLRMDDMSLLVDCVLQFR